MRCRHALQAAAAVAGLTMQAAAENGWKVRPAAPLAWWKDSAASRVLKAVPPVTPSVSPIITAQGQSGREKGRRQV